MTTDAERSSKPRGGPPVTSVAVALQVLDRLGGAERFVDIEEVAAEAFAIAPDRFGWRTRAWASWERVRTAFVHANQEARRRGRPSVVISSRDGDAWRLTADGVRAAREASDLSPGGACAPVPRRGARRSLERIRQIRKHTAFLRFAHGTPVSDLERFVIADLLLCPPDSSLAAALRKVDKAKAAAIDAEDQDVIEFLGAVEAEVQATWSL